jgi:ribonuclease R
MAKGAKKYLEGIIFVTSRGTGYVTVEGREKDIFIESSDLGTALHNDHVVVGDLTRARTPAGFVPKGKVLKVLSRAKTKFVGVVKKERDKLYVVPDDRKVYRNFLVTAGDGLRCRDGEKVAVELTEWTSVADDPKVKLLEVLGKAGEHETEMRAIVVAAGFDAAFPKEVEEAADRIPRTISPQEIAKRKDFRGVPTFTIDPADAKDFDDALSIRQTGANEWQVGVHIADVSHYVKEDSVLDQEAVKRATSIYLVDRTIPMLPEVLSNDLCSLKPDTDRLTFSAVFVLDAEA